MALCVKVLKVGITKSMIESKENRNFVSKKQKINETKPLYVKS